MKNQMECLKEVDRIFKGIMDRMYADDFPIVISKIKPHIMPLTSNRNLGCCERSWGSHKYQICLNKHLVKLVFEESKLNAIKSVLVHEIIHTFSGCMNHGPNFKHYAMLANSKYENIEVWTHATKLEKEVFDKEIEDNVKFVAKCLCCGKEVRKFRKTRFTQQMTGEINGGKTSYYCLCQKGNTKENHEFVTTYVLTKKDGIKLSKEDYILPKNLSTVARKKYQELFKEELKTVHLDKDILFLSPVKKEEKKVACKQPPTTIRRKKKNIDDISISLF